VNVAAAPLQQELWHLDRYAGAASVLHVPVAWQITGRLDPVALGSAVDTLVARHEALRASYPARDGVPLLAVAPVSPGQLTVIDRADPRDRDRLLREFFSEPFDLPTGPLARARLFRFSETDNVLAWCFHHIVVDAWSLDLIESELSELYRQAVAGSVAQVSPGYRLADVTSALHEHRYGTAWQEDLRYWSDQLHGVSGVDLPLVERPTPNRFAAARLRRCLDPALTARLREVSHSAGATAFHVLLAGYAGLLARWTNTADVVIGVPIAARAREQVADVVMFAANVAPIRIRAGDNPSFLDLVRQVKQAVYAALDHQSAPLSDVVRHIGAEPGDDVATLAQIAATHRSRSRGLTFPGLRVESLPVDRDFSLYRLAMHVEQGPDEIWLELEGRQRSRDELDRLWQRLDAVLRAVTADPAARIATWPVTLPHERGATPDPARHQTVERVPDAFIRAATTFPGHTALVVGERRVTYWQLMRAVGAVAHALRTAPGSTSNEIVAVCASRGAATASSLLGILIAGLTYLPVDPAWPTARMRSILDDAGVRRVLVTSDTADHPGLEGRELLPAWPDAGRVLRRAHQSTPSAYLLYTSGSTGTPKGVLFGYEALANLIEQMRGYCDIGPGGKVLASTTTTFDISLVELLLPLTVGAVCVIADDETAKDPTLLARLVADERVDLVEATPTMWRALLENLTVTIPVVITAGEPMSDTLREQLLDRSGRCFNGYGPTETNYATMWQAERDTPVSIGRSINGIDAWVLDRWDQPCAERTVGRLVLSGVGVGDGYLNRPELTAERFRDGLPGLTTRRAYETGDLASVGPDGLLYLHGRSDDQIKLRGFRIELGEVEAVVTAVAGVDAAAVVPYTLGEDQRGLAAFVVAERDSDIVGRVRDAFATQLPEYARPQIVRIIDRLPQTSSGKIDRLSLAKTIAAPDMLAEDLLTEDVVAASSPLQRELATLWREMLGIESVSVRKTFFDLGGDSIGAARVVARIKKRVGIRISLQEFLRDSTIEGVERLLVLRSDEAGSGR
jgi:amino acid adenylation domain-containing protein